MAYGISGSGAWFTDQVSLENNSISTGSIDLVLSDVVKSDPDLEPGGEYQEMLRFCVKNGGSYNMKWRGMLSAVQAPTGMTDQILMRGLIINPGKKSGDHHDDENTIWFKDQPASALTSANKYLLLDASTNPEPFKPDDSQCYAIQAKLKDSAGSAFQNKAFKANLQLDATQWINNSSGWSE